MQPRVLVKEEEQKKKRFIYSTEIKNFVYGDKIRPNYKQRFFRLTRNNPSSRSKSGKKDYIMTQLSKINDKNVSKNQETQSKILQFSLKNKEQKKLSKNLSFDTKQNQVSERQHQPHQDPQNSTLAVNLKKVHQQKGELHQKKIQVEREKNEYNQRLESQEIQLINLRKQLQHSQMQNLFLTSELKSILQAETYTKSQLQDTSARNQQLYSEIQEKYTSIMKDYKNSIVANEKLIQKIEQKEIQKINLEKRNQLNEQRLKQFQQKLQNQQNQHLEKLQKITCEWMDKYEKVERELRKQKEKEVSLGNDQKIKNKFIEIENELENKNSLLQKKNQDLSREKNELSIKFTNLEKILFQKEKEIDQLSTELKRQQKKSIEKILQSQKIIKDLHLLIAKRDRELQIKKLSFSSNQTQINPFMLKSQIQIIYSKKGENVETSDATSTIQRIVSTQTQQINYYKKSLNQKLQQNFDLRSQFDQLRSQNHNTKQELEIMKLQYSALIKKQEQFLSTEICIAKNQLQTALRKQKELEQKLESKQNEIKEKEQFIQFFLSNTEK